MVSLKLCTLYMNYSRTTETKEANEYTSSSSKYNPSFSTKLMGSGVCVRVVCMQSLVVQETEKEKKERQNKERKEDSVHVNCA